MKKILLWHIVLGVVFEAMLATTMLVKNVNYTLALLVVFMIISSAGYFYLGTKECTRKIFVTAAILLGMTLVTAFAINPMARFLSEKSSLAALLLFPYGGAESFIQFGVYLAKNSIHSGAILGKIALFIPSLLILAGALVEMLRGKKVRADE